MLERLAARLTLLRLAVKPALTFGLSVAEPKGHCYVCGHYGEFRFGQVINDDLARQWELKPRERHAFDCRESMFCAKCGCSYRLRHTAEALIYLYGKGKKAYNLNDLIAKGGFDDVSVAEINSCGVMHENLSKMPRLKYSEYGSKDPKVPNESLEKLSYKDDTFDLVLTSDTLEHVPDHNKSLAEICRVLKPGGYHVFTVPAVWGRKNRSRQGMEDSFHGAGEPDYKVFMEFGYDITGDLQKAGFDVQMYRVNPINLSDPSCVLLARKIN